MYQCIRKTYLAATIAIALTQPIAARAHFLWADITPGTKPQLRVRFTEGPIEPTLVDLLPKIEAVQCASGGRPLRPVRTNGVLSCEVDASAKVITAQQTWGVLDKSTEGRGVFLLEYTAKAAATSNSASERSGQTLEITAEREGALWAARVALNGKPYPGADVVVYEPETGRLINLRTDASGCARFAGLGKGTCGIRASAAENIAGSYEGKPYAMVRRYATLTFPLEKPSKSATEVLSVAHELRDHWGEGFPGFSGTLHVERGDKQATGTFTVTSKGEARLEMTETELAGIAKGMLQSLAMHRMGGSGQYNATFASEEFHPQGQAINLGDANRSLYRVKDGVLRQVNRVAGPVKFTIDVLSLHELAGGRHLPAAYTVTYRDAKTDALVRTETFTESFTSLGGFNLPSDRTSVVADGAKSVFTRYRFTGLKLLPVAATTNKE